MERRRLIDDEPQKELPLELPPQRRRLDWLEREEPQMVDYTVLGPKVDVTLRVPKETARKWEEMKRGGTSDAALMQQALHRFVEETAGVTGWYNEMAPACSGFYEIKQRSAKDGAAVRWWYGPVASEGNAWLWYDPTPSHTSKEAQEKMKGIPHETFMKSHVWRGLQKEWPLGYSYALSYPTYRGKDNAGSGPASPVTVKPRRRVAI